MIENYEQIGNLLITLRNRIEPYVGYDEIQQWPQGWRVELERMGILIETSPAKEFTCSECHGKECGGINLTIHTNKQTGEGVGLFMCQEESGAGLKRVMLERLRRWEIVAEKITSIIITNEPKENVAPVHSGNRKEKNPKKKRPTAIEMKNRDRSVLMVAIKLHQQYGRLPTVGEIVKQTGCNHEQIYATAAYKDGKIARRSARPTSEMTGSSINQSEYFGEKSIAHSRADRSTKSEQLERDNLIDESLADEARDEKQHQKFLRKKRKFNSEE